MPMTKVDKTICALLGLCGVNSSEMSDKAGNIASIDIATVATSIAIIATNSVVETRKDKPLYP